MSRCICSINLKHFIFINGGSSCLLSLFYFCCFTTTITTIITTTTTTVSQLLLIPLCKQVFISGAVELTTQLSKPVRILCVPKCRINKLGYLAREDYLDPLQLRAINRPVGFHVLQEGGQTSKAPFEISYSLDLDLHTKAYNFAPNEYREVVNLSSLVVYKESKQEWK